MKHPLDRSVIYLAVQRFCGGNVHELFESSLKSQLVGGEIGLDLGCGPRFIGWETGPRYTLGVDLNSDYLTKFIADGREFSKNSSKMVAAVSGSIVDLPLMNNSICQCWSIGLFHHLSNSQLLIALDEIRRVVVPGGRVVIIDNILPKFYQLPLAWIIRKMDRGRFVRRESELVELIKSKFSSSSKVVSRITYGFAGLEAVVISCSVD